MSLGILNNVSAIYAENNLNNTQSSLQKVLQQLSSGARINSGADDAAGLAVADGLKANEAALTQSTQNAANGIGLLQTADGALSQVTNLLDRAVTLATEAASGTLSNSQVSSADQEYQSILSEVGNIGTTTNFNGISVFSSNAVSTYVGDGTASGSNYYNNTVGTLSASTLGESAPTPLAGTSFLTTTSSGNASLVDTAGSYNTVLTFARPTDTISGTLSITPVGGSATAVTFGAGTTYAAALSAIHTAFDSTETVSTSTSGGVNTITILNATPVALNSSASTLTDTQGVAPITVATAGVTSGGTIGSTSSSILSALRVPATDTISGSVGVVLTGNKSASVTHSFAAGTTLSQAVSLINGDASFKAAGIVASISGSNALQFTGPGQTGTADTYKLTATSNLFDSPAVQAPNAGTNLSGTSITTSGASTVLVNLNNAIANVAYQRGILGADNNELQAASNTASSENVNLTASESSIRSTNYGEATSNLAKFEVLSQTGISALAQANTVQQEILKLLQ